MTQPPFEALPTRPVTEVVNPLAQLQALQAAARHPDPAIHGPALNHVWVANSLHGTFVDGQIAAVELVGAHIGLAETQLTEGHGRATVFDLRTCTNGIKPEDLGLPALAGDTTKVLGIVVWRGNDPSQSIIEAIGVDQRVDPQTSLPLQPVEVRRLLLESPSAAMACEGANDAAWVPMGLGYELTPTISGAAGDMLVNADRNPDGTICELLVRPASLKGSCSVIRNVPTDYERQAAILFSAEDQNVALKAQQSRSKRSKALAAVLSLASLGVGAGMALGPSEMPDRLAVRNANDLVGSRDDAFVDGKPQAEAAYTEAILGRSREAVAAWMKGDEQGLNDIMAKYHYTQNWLPADKVEALDTATSFKELQDRFKALFPGSDIDLEVTSSSSMGLLDECTRDYLNVDELDQAKAGARAITDVLNAYDQRILNGAKIHFALSKNMRSKKNNMEAGGYAWYDGERTVIEIDATSDYNILNVAHEIKHMRNYMVNYEFTNSILRLNPPGLSESPYIPYSELTEETATKIDQYKLFAYSYGRTYVDEYPGDAGVEDDATVSEGWFEPAGVLQLDRSPLGEKRMNDLFELEEQYPGATAAFLKMAKPTAYTTVTASDNVIWGLGEMGRLPARGVFFGLFASFAYALVQSKKTKTIREQVAVAIGPQSMGFGPRY